MAIDSPMKRFSMLNMAGGAVFPRLFEPDGAVDADDRAFLLRLYGGSPFDSPVVVVTPDGRVLTIGERDRALAVLPRTRTVVPQV